MTGFVLVYAARGILRRRARSLITFGALALGVAILVFLSALMIGVTDAMVANTVAIRTGHVLVKTTQPARWRHRRLPPGFTGSLPRRLESALLVTDQSSSPVVLQGVVLAQEARLSVIGARLVAGATPTSAEEILLGQPLAQELGVALGGSLLVRRGDGSARHVKVSGLFATGLDALDRGVIQTPFDEADTAAPGEVALFVDAGMPLPRALELLAPLLAPDESASTWETLLPELEQLTRLNNMAMQIMIALVVVLMAAGVSNTVLVSVLDRRRDFGLLKALGVRPREVCGLILLETALLTVVAGGLGFGLGALAVLASAGPGIDLSAFTSANPHFALSGVLHPRLVAAWALGPVGAVLGVSLLAALGPALAAARRSPGETMRDRA